MQQSGQGGSTQEQSHDDNTENQSRPVIDDGKEILLHDLDGVANCSSPITLGVIATNEGPRSFADAMQEQSEFDIIHHGQSQSFKPAALVIGVPSNQIECPDAKMRPGPVLIHTGYPV